MSDPKFTKGEWFINGGDPALISSQRGNICEVFLDKPFISIEENTANKSLIRTAPKMYAALVKAKKQIKVFALDKNQQYIADAYCQEIDWLLEEARGE